MKRCSKCKVGKETSEFTVDKSNRDGLGTWCRMCTSKVNKANYEMNKERMQAESRAYHAAHKDDPEWSVKNRLQQRNSYYRRTYGITLAERDAMVEEQNGLCMICEKPPKKSGLYLDHNHTTGVTRGLLCVTCNSRIGILEDEDFMARAAAYLEVHQRA